MSAMTAAAEAESTGGIVGWVTGLMEKLGSPGAGVAVFLENLFPPIPSELILPLAGFTASRGDLSLAAAIGWTTVGSTLGALVLYFLGAGVGRDRTRALVQKLPLVKVSDVDRTEEWFLRHGRSTVFFGRMVPLFRSLISIPAGVERMPLVLFVPLTAAGSALWNSALILAGYFLGEHWSLVEVYVGMFSKAIVAVGALAVAAFVVVRLLRRDGDQDDERGGERDGEWEERRARRGHRRLGDEPAE
ncbi:membrane protein DedA, SNARE-associated domain [Actinopolymorpha singaporensis]|uniref:Membrane protein DedA, SNARE-associated domain n=2 Tax=Actinopolymorpha singaporensis TaxID=117157 RepID=A0A1H1N8Q1_9ACTN|nr:membrane protein DedA, SNARE-associated domain [Actinopolymorpha singaporensis]